MKLSVVGMTGAGKSYWAKKLAEEGGYRRIDCDGNIAQILREELEPYREEGMEDVEVLGRWLGFPEDEHFEERSETYYKAEVQVMREVLVELERADPDENIVIDTTGSVYMMSKDILDEMKKLTTVIYLETLPEDVGKMIEFFRSEQRPLMWGDSYNRRQGEETRDEALIRCYPGLLEFRRGHYESLAHVTIPTTRLRSPDFNVKDFLNAAERK